MPQWLLLMLLMLLMLLLTEDLVLPMVNIPRPMASGGAWLDSSTLRECRIGRPDRSIGSRWMQLDLARRCSYCADDAPARHGLLRGDRDR